MSECTVPVGFVCIRTLYVRVRRMGIQVVCNRMLVLLLLVMFMVMELVVTYSRLAH